MTVVLAPCMLSWDEVDSLPFACPPLPPNLLPIAGFRSRRVAGDQMVQIMTRCSALPGAQRGLIPRILRLPQAPCSLSTDRHCRPAPWAPAAPTHRLSTIQHQSQRRKTAAFAASVSAPPAENILGRAFLALLPGVTYYLASFAIPASVCLAAWGATHSAAVLTALTGQPAALQVSVRWHLCNRDSSSSSSSLLPWQGG